jgi:hypothetical protein
MVIRVVGPVEAADLHRQLDRLFEKLIQVSAPAPGDRDQKSTRDRTRET